MMLRWRLSIVAVVLLGAAAQNAVLSATVRAEDHNFAYFELEGTAEDFQFHRQWRSYYWREDFTLSVRDAAGKAYRVISREPTPWCDLRFGTTFTGRKVDWKQRPRVKIIGVKAVDRMPAEFYDLPLDPGNTATAFIVRVRDAADSAWQDYYVNNWFHHWGPEADVKMLTHYANADPNYTVYGHVGGIAAPFDQAGQKLVEKFSADFGGMIYHARVVKGQNKPGYELRVLHLMGRHKKTAQYQVFYGEPGQLVHLDQRQPQ